MSGTAARNYERFVASWFRPWAVDLVARAGLQPGWDVVEVACGTGVLTRAAAAAVGADGAITATDLDEGMLAEAARHEVASALVRWRTADATALPFLAGSFDAVLCQQGLQFVPDRLTAAREMRRVLRSGGVAAASVWRAPEHNPYISALAEGLRRHLSEAAAASMLAPCGFGDPDELAELFRGAGFSQVEVQASTIARDPVDAATAIAGNLAALPVAEEVLAMDADARAAMTDDIVAQLAPFIHGGALSAPSSANTVVAVV